jgi:hypothetical protein
VVTNTSDNARKTYRAKSKDATSSGSGGRSRGRGSGRNRGGRHQTSNSSEVVASVPKNIFSTGWQQPAKDPARKSTKPVATEGPELFTKPSQTRRAELRNRNASDLHRPDDSGIALFDPSLKKAPVAKAAQLNDAARSIDSPSLIQTQVNPTKPIHHSPARSPLQAGFSRKANDATSAKNDTATLQDESFAERLSDHTSIKRSNAGSPREGGPRLPSAVSALSIDNANPHMEKGSLSERGEVKADLSDLIEDEVMGMIDASMVDSMDLDDPDTTAQQGVTQKERDKVKEQEKDRNMDDLLEAMDLKNKQQNRKIHPDRSALLQAASADTDERLPMSQTSPQDGGSNTRSSTQSPADFRPKEDIGPLLKSPRSPRNPLKQDEPNVNEENEVRGHASTVAPHSAVSRPSTDYFHATTPEANRNHSPSLSDLDISDSEVLSWSINVNLDNADIKPVTAYDDMQTKKPFGVNNFFIFDGPEATPGVITLQEYIVTKGGSVTVQSYGERDSDWQKFYTTGAEGVILVSLNIVYTLV